MTSTHCAAAALIVAALALGAGTAASGEEHEGGCVFDRRIYPEGYEMCQWGTLKRCESGAWGDIGMCERKPMPEPVPGGPDVEVKPEEEQPQDERRR